LIHDGIITRLAPVQKEKKVDPCRNYYPACPCPEGEKGRSMPELLPGLPLSGRRKWIHAGIITRLAPVQKEKKVDPCRNYYPACPCPEGEKGRSMPELLPSLLCPVGEKKEDPYRNYYPACPCPEGEKGRSMLNYYPASHCADEEKENPCCIITRLAPVREEKKVDPCRNYYPACPCPAGEKKEDPYRNYYPACPCPGGEKGRSMPDYYPACPCPSGEKKEDPYRNY
jgi:hypothetical protein